VLHPTGLADFDGIIYISEALRHRVLFRSESDEHFQVLAEGSPLVAPEGLAVDGQYVYVADPAAHDVFQIDRASHSVSALLPPNAEISPNALAYAPVYNFDNQRLSSRPGFLILDTASKQLLRIDPSRLSTGRIDAWGNKSFSDPVAITSADRNILVVDGDAKTVFETTNNEFWSDIRRSSTSSLASATGYFFPVFSQPKSVYALGDVIYLIDGEKLFAFVRGANRLVPLAYQPHPLVDPQQVIVDPSRNTLLISDTTPQGVTSWPLLLPVTIEVQAGGDVSTPLAALYEYLWQQKVLPTVQITLPYTSPTSEVCKNLACVIERGRNIQPKTNLQIERTLCSINPSVCRKDRITKLRLGETLLFPDIPFESYLSVGNQTGDGNSSVGDLLDKLIPDRALRSSVDEKFVKSLNPKLKSLRDEPDKGASISLPVQRTRYYVSIPKSEVLSANSLLAGLIHNFPELSVRPYGVYALKGLSPPQQQAPGSPQPDVNIHTADELKTAHASILSTIDFNPEQFQKYLLANDAPILIAEPDGDCHHPAFFTNDDRSFDSPDCSTAETVNDSVVVDWAETDKRHGTCVASIIGAKAAALYGPGLASGSELRLANSGTLNSSALINMYRDFKEPFVVNISNVAPDVGAENTWRNLFKSGIAKFALFVVAAGNENGLLESKKDYPALLADEFPNVISVGALDKGGTFVWEDSAKQQGSNTGLAVELLAPGEAVPCATEVIDGKAVYSIAPGTSFAAPLVSGIAALLLDRKLSPPEVKARLLATAVPLEKQRDGQPLSRFGRLSLGRALLDPKHSHLDYSDNPSAPQIDADAVTDNTSISYQSELDQSWNPIALSDVLSIDLLNASDSKKLYRLVRFSKDTKQVSVINNVPLSGCFLVTPKGLTDQYLIMFGDGGGCSQLTTIKPDHWIANLKSFIAPRLGSDKF